MGDKSLYAKVCMKNDWGIYADCFNLIQESNKGLDPNAYFCPESVEWESDIGGCQAMMLIPSNTPESPNIDYEVLAQIWSFGFISVLALWLIAYKVGAIVKFVDEIFR